MFTFETLLALLSYSAAAVVTYCVFVRFSRSTTDQLAALIGALAASLGLLVIPGALHTAAVIGVAVTAGKPYDVRFAWLITTGALLIYTGAINLCLSMAIKRSEKWAMTTSAAATFALLLFLISLHPAKHQTGLLLLLGAYIILVLSWLNISRRTKAA